MTVDREIKRHIRELEIELAREKGRNEILSKLLERILTKLGLIDDIRKLMVDV